MPEAAFPTPSGQPTAVAPAKTALAPTVLHGVNLSDPTSIVTFGADVQREATAKANELLAQTRVGEAGEAGETLSTMLLTLRGFKPADATKEGNVISRLFTSAKTQVAKAVQQFDTVKSQVEKIAADMEAQRTKLLTDITTTQGIYESTLVWFHDLGEKIDLGEQVLAAAEADLARLVALAQKDTSDPLLPQRVRDQQTAKDEFERRLHDLRLTRQVVMQNLPALRLIQDNDRALVGKIQSVLTNTVPLWIQQMAQAILVQRMASTGKNLQAAADLTNELLVQNAEALRQGNQTVRTQIERGVFDVEAVVKANDTLIATLEDSLRIAEQAKQARVTAKAALDKAEDDMKQALRRIAKA